MKYLVCKSVKFRSIYDRQVLLEQFARVSLISKITIKGNSIFLYLGEIASADDGEVRALICLFWRYGINMQQLAIFWTPENQVWLGPRSGAYWSNLIFPRGIRI